MQMRTVSWPVSGDRTTFRRRLLLLIAAGAATIATTLVITAATNPALLQPMLPLAGSALLLVLLWTHGAARATARRAEVERSFAGLVVLHQGRAYAVADRPVLGEYATRRDAAHAALERGDWAIIVRAWERWYLLAANPTTDGSPRTSPVSFRSAAVADVVPAVRADAAIA